MKSRWAFTLFLWWTCSLLWPWFWRAVNRWVFSL